MPVGSPTYLDYQPDADDNAAAAPIGAPEGSYQGRWVNDTSRFMMAVIRRLGDSALHRDGSAVPTADADWGGFKITNLAKGTGRLHAARLDQVQEGQVTWGGTTGGSGAAYTLTMSPGWAGLLGAGNTVRAIVHATNTSPAPTLDIGSPSGPKVIVHRNAAALALGSLRISTRYTFEYDGAAWRALDAGGYMEQATYDAQWPVNGPLQIRYDTVDPNTQLPAGIVATWTQINDTAFVKINSAAAPGTTGGSATSGGTAISTSQMPVHGHLLLRDAEGDGSAPGGSEAVAQRESGGGDSNYAMAGASGEADIGQSSLIGGSQPHTHPNIDPPHRNYRAWRRTA